jgi:DnaJ like chaperone protein
MIKLLLLPDIPRQPSELEVQIGSYFLGFIMIGIIVLSFFLIKDYYKNSEWKKGIFPSSLPFERDNFLKAYICLSANMIRRDNRNISMKKVYVTTFIKREFSDTSIDYSSSLNFSLKYPIQIDTVSYWLNLHITDNRVKLQIINLLIGISIVDGSLVKNELWLLRELIRQFKLEQKDLDTILSFYFEEDQKLNFSNSKLTNKENALNLLGLNQNATQKEIKKAYRKLAMINHPDKFSMDGEEQLKLAQERFLKIQEAYECLIKS